MTTIVRLPDRPFPDFWEQDPRADTCPHQWETVHAEWYPMRLVDVDRCKECHTPRCDTMRDGGQCVERRHHRTVHIWPNGEFEPVGGYLRAEQP